MPSFALDQLAWLSEVFPPNGLDRSLHAPVLAGLCILSLFRETLGWSYAGLVVPGYLAAVFIVARVTGTLVIVESLVAYGFAALVGRWLPKTGAWSSLFGRERFLLLIITAIFVRLVMEASFLPWLASKYEFAHSRELYSVGLVLVPLLANSYWNAGVVTAFPRVLLITLLTYVFVDQVLLEFTNFTVSRFQVANENVSLTFLQAPHAYIILIVGAIIAARDNIRYGWDYNGILVPALLAVSCYQPTKLLTTVVEAIVILFLSRWLVELPPFSRTLMVGSRRMVVCFGVGFVSKWLIGSVVFVVAPEVQMVDFFGFGYLLPSLLAVKMWNTSRIGATLMPTLQVAVVAFLVGNGLGAVLRFADSDRTQLAQHQEYVEKVQTPVAWRLMLADTAPAPHPPKVRWGAVDPHQQALAVLEQLSNSAAPSWQAPLSIQEHPGGWLTLTPSAGDPDDDRIAPRIAVRIRGESANWLVVIETSRAASPAIVIGHRIAQALNAKVLALRSRLLPVRAYDDALLEQLSALYALSRVMVVRESVAGPPSLSVVGSVPADIDVGDLSQDLGSDIKVFWRALAKSQNVYANAAILNLPRAITEARAASELSAPEVSNWPEQLQTALTTRSLELTEVTPGRYEQPSIEKLRLFGQALLPGFIQLRKRAQAPTAWQRALAHRLNYRFAELASRSAWVLHEPGGGERRGNATFAVTTSTEPPQHPLAIEVPAPRWERGVLDAAFSLQRAVGANAFLMAGAMPSADLKGASDARRAAGARSYYQHAHEVWLQQGGRALALHGVSPNEPSPADAIVSFQHEATTPLAGPVWTRPLVHALEDSGLSVYAVDGSYETAAFDGSMNPPFAYAKRFGQGQMVLLWLTSAARSRFLQVQQDSLTEQRVIRSGRLEPFAETVERALLLANCQPGAKHGTVRSDCPEPRGDADCVQQRVVEQLLQYNSVKNPYLLSAVLKHPGCSVEVTKDSGTARLWAVVPSSNHVELVPLRTGPTARGKHILTGAEEILRALAIGLSTVRVGAGK